MKRNSVTLDPEDNLELVKRFLEQGPVLRDQIQSLEIQWQVLTGRAFSLASPGHIATDRVQTSPAPEASFADPLEKRNETEEKLRQSMLMMRALNEQIIGVINQYTTGSENLALTLRYVKGMKVKKIVEEMNYSDRQIRRFFEEGIEKIILPENAIWIKKEQQSVLE